MGEENRTLTTEYTEPVAAVDVVTENKMEISQYAIDIMAEFFLRKMREEYMREHNTN